MDEKIIENMRKIKNYLLEKAQHIEGNLSIKFIGNYKYSIDISNYGSPSVSAWCGCNVCYSWDEKIDRNKTLSVYDNEDFCISTMRNWQYIKASIDERIKQQEETKKLVNNFEI